MFGDEAVDSGLSMLTVNEVSPATTELVDNEIKRLLHVSRIFINFSVLVPSFEIQEAKPS